MYTQAYKFRYVKNHEISVIFIWFSIQLGTIYEKYIIDRKFKDEISYACHSGYLMNDINCLSCNRHGVNLKYK